MDVNPPAVKTLPNRNTRNKPNGWRAKDLSTGLDSRNLTSKSRKTAPQQRRNQEVNKAKKPEMSENDESNNNFTLYLTLKLINFQFCCV